MVRLLCYVEADESMAEAAGLEPTKRESKSRVLPLHYASMLN